jgi:hypothetical protein
MKYPLKTTAVDIPEADPELYGAIQPRVQRLLQQTTFKLAQNELREWGKILMTHRPAVQAGIVKRVNKGAVKKTAIAAAALGIGYYLLKRR